MISGGRLLMVCRSFARVVVYINALNPLNLFYFIFFTFFNKANVSAKNILTCPFFFWWWGCRSHCLIDDTENRCEP